MADETKSLPTLRRYRPEDRGAWDEFVARSKNGIFQFRRDYMEYHADRFADFSLLALNDSGAVAALLPASISGDTVTSHAGLTFGGFVTDERMKAAPMLALFEALGSHLRGSGVARLIYKAVPHIYHRIPAEEDRYALFRVGARLVRCDISSALLTSSRPPLSKGRKYAAKQAEKAGLAVEESGDFEGFMALEAELLAAKYGTTPTHSGAEMKLLAERFPEHIRLFVVRHGKEIIAGVVMYLYPTVAHAQYIAASDPGKAQGALDLIIETLISETFAQVPVFDFGISTEEQGTVLNEGLIANKQSFGGRAVVHETYEWRIAG